MDSAQRSLGQRPEPKRHSAPFGRSHFFSAGPGLFDSNEHAGGQLGPLFTKHDPAMKLNRHRSAAFRLQRLESSSQPPLVEVRARASALVKPHRGGLFIATSAFTLMEVMLALVVSAIVLAGIGGVFYSAIRLRDRTTAMLDESTPLHQTLNFLRRDLQGALPPGGLYAMAGDFKIEQLSGQSFRIQFFTTTGVIDENTPWGELQEVA